MKIETKLDNLIKETLKSSMPTKKKVTHLQQAVEIGYGLGMSEKDWSGYLKHLHNKTNVLEPLLADMTKGLLIDLEVDLDIPRGRPYKGSVEHEVHAFLNRHIMVSVFIEEESNTLEDWEIKEMVDEQIKERAESHPLYQNYRSQSYRKGRLKMSCIIYLDPTKIVEL